MRMIKSETFQRTWLAMAGLVAALAVPTAAEQSDGLAMLNGLTKGQWTIKYRDDAAQERICIRSGEELIQLKHRKPGCSRFIVEDGSARVTVQYTCPGDGYGRTSIRRETNELIQIESQGISGGLPFEFAAEARRTGNC